MIRRVAENPSRSWALATLVRTGGSTYRKPGARMLIDSDGRTLGVLSGGCLEEEIAQHGQRVIDDVSPVLLSFDTKLLYGCDGQLKILIEPLTQLAENLGWIVERFGHPTELAHNFRPDAQTAALVMTHNFGRDLLALDRLLPLRLGYIGLLGPRKRHAELVARLSEYRPFDFDAGIKNLFAPAGLDIGSEAPEEIALAIVSEVAAVLSNRMGGFLRERRSDIHTITKAAGGEAA